MRQHHTHCQLCGNAILYGFACENCVSLARVCQMCGVSIAHRNSDASTCNNSCKQARKRGIASGLMGVRTPVPNSPPVIHDVVTKQDLEAMAFWLRDEILGTIRQLGQGSETNSIATSDPIREQLKVLTELLLQQGAVPIESGEKASEQKQLAKRDDSDDEFDLVVTEAKATAEVNAGFNFMIAAAWQVYGNYDGLRNEVIEYGIRNNKIPKDAIPAKYKAVAVENYPQFDKPLRDIAEGKANDGNPKAMDVPEFDAPEFEEIDLNDWNL